MHPLSPLMSTNLILLFHVVPSAPWFADTLRKVGQFYNFISFDDVESYCHSRDRDFNNCCHVCFDDGEISVYENAFPVLREMNIPATVFVSPRIVREGHNYWFQELRHIRKRLGDELLKREVCDILGRSHRELGKYRILSIFKSLRFADILQVISALKSRHGIELEARHNISGSQLCELTESGVFTVGAHTLNHPILSNESDSDAETEIRESIEQLSAMLETGVRYFSYPNGTSLDFGAREQTMLRRCGIRIAVTEHIAFFSKNSEPLSVPRVAFSATGSAVNRGILTKLLLLPIWETLRTSVRFGRTETVERSEIKEKALLRPETASEQP